MKELQSRYPVSQRAQANTHIDAATYEAMYRQSIEQPDVFWAEQAEKFIDWYQPWQQVSSVNFKESQVSWFAGGKLNVSYNCIDRHLAKKANDIAVIFGCYFPNENKKPNVLIRWVSK